MTRRRVTEHHDPDDPDIALKIRLRREMLGLSVAELAAQAGVSEQSWRNYERGRTQVRGDKQLGVWQALGWELPETDAGLARFVSYGESVVNGLMTEYEHECLLDEALRQGYGALRLPCWADVPDLLPESYSPLLAATLDEPAARCFALGAQTYDQIAGEALVELLSLPRGAHLGELLHEHLSRYLPALWMTRYDYEFVFQLRGLGQSMQDRLVGGRIGRHEPLVRSPAEAIVLHGILTVGTIMAPAGGGPVLGPIDAEGWVSALSGPDDLVRELLETTLMPSVGSAEHFDNWFFALDEPFVPAWSAPDTSRIGGIVIRLHRR